MSHGKALERKHSRATRHRQGGSRESWVRESWLHGWRSILLKYCCIAKIRTGCALRKALFVDRLFGVQPCLPRPFDHERDPAKVLLQVLQHQPEPALTFRELQDAGALVARTRPPDVTAMVCLSPAASWRKRSPTPSSGTPEHRLEPSPPQARTRSSEVTAAAWLLPAATWRKRSLTPSSGTPEHRLWPSTPQAMARPVDRP